MIALTLHGFFYLHIRLMSVLLFQDSSIWFWHNLTKRSRYLDQIMLQNLLSLNFFMRRGCYISYLVLKDPNKALLLRGNINIYWMWHENSIFSLTFLLLFSRTVSLLLPSWLTEHRLHYLATKVHLCYCTENRWTTIPSKGLGVLPLQLPYLAIEQNSSLKQKYVSSWGTPWHEGL